MLSQTFKTSTFSRQRQVGLSLRPALIQSKFQDSQGYTYVEKPKTKQKQNNYDKTLLSCSVLSWPCTLQSGHHPQSQPSSLAVCELSDFIRVPCCHHMLCQRPRTLILIQRLSPVMFGQASHLPSPV